MSKNRKIKKILISSSLLVTASFPIIGTSIVNNHVSKLDINNKSSSSHFNSSSVSKSNDIKISSTNKQSEIVNTKTTTNADVSSYYKLDTSTASQGYSRLKVLNSNGTESGISIKIPNFSNSSESAQATASQILGVYNGIPSNIVTTGESSNISSIIEIDTSKWKSTSDSSNPSKIFNLGAASTYNNNYRNNSSGSSSTSGSTTTTPTSFDTITSTTQLPAFNQVSSTDNGTTTNTPVTEEFLDDNGILALQVTVTPASITSANTATYQSYYLLIPGFGGYLNNNAMSNNPMLPSDYYSGGVSSLSNSSLISFLLDSFNTSSSQGKPNVSIVSRNNNNLQGILNFTSNFLFENTSGVTFSNGFAGVTDNNASSLSSTTGQSVAVVSTTSGNTSTNVYTTGSTSYDMNFTISGFQPISAISDSSVMIITGVIIATAVVVCIAGYFVSKTTKAIRYRNAL